MGDIGRHFNRSEFACKCGCGQDEISPDLVEILDRIREMTGRPLVITSGVRCEIHNEAEGGKPDSAHLYGLAADIKIKNSHERYEIILFALMQGILRIGIAQNFIHIDIDESKAQDVAWPYK